MASHPLLSFFSAVAAAASNCRAVSGFALFVQTAVAKVEIASFH